MQTPGCVRRDMLILQPAAIKGGAVLRRWLLQLSSLAVVLDLEPAQWTCSEPETSFVDLIKVR